MSRIAKKPLTIANGAKVTVNGQRVDVEGKGGKLTFNVHENINVAVNGNEIAVERKNDERLSKALHGTTWRILSNMMTGVTTGFRIVLEMRGVGYKAELKGKRLGLTVGFANQIVKEVPAGVTAVVEPGAGDVTNRIVITGPDKQQVGAFASDVRKVRKPEPYKGKGIRYEGEVVKIKPGKAFAGAGAK